jgi:hypothetical protein
MAVLILFAVLALPGAVMASDGGTGTPLPGKDAIEKGVEQKSYSPYVGRNFPTQPLWGDTHLHTAASLDAFAYGNKLDAEQAYRFARGEEVRSSDGMRVRLSRPLDWLVVTDHSDNMGFFTDLIAGAPHLMKDPQSKDWYNRIQAGEGPKVAYELINLFANQKFPDRLMYKPDSAPYKSVWQQIIKAADEYNDPGNFTAFIGYEWTSLIKGNNKHRNVIYRDGSEKASQMVPYTTTRSQGSENPRDLYKWLTMYEEKTGGDVLALAHNGNLSNGLMFSETTFTGKPIDRDYARTRIKWEPLAEVTQIKGDGEAHPFLSPDDEFADFENWDKANLDGTVAKEKKMLQGEYMRPALKIGLKLGKKAGVNPYKFGVVGSTDSHTSMSTSREENYFGKLPKK